MSGPRFLLALENIPGHTVCFPPAPVFVCLDTVMAALYPMQSGLLPPAPMQKRTSLSGTLPLLAETRSCFERAVSVLSP